MNSLQALEDLIDEIKYTHSNGKDLTDYDQERIDAIEEDLKALGFLRPLIRGRIDFARYIDFDNIVLCIRDKEGKVLYWIPIDSKEYEFLKKWSDKNCLMND